jgi:hypothetical protein
MGPNSDHIYHTDEVAAELGYHSQGGNALDHYPLVNVYITMENHNV